MATRTEAMKPKDLARVVVDTTVQPKAVMFPTDATVTSGGASTAIPSSKKSSPGWLPIMSSMAGMTVANVCKAHTKLRARCKDPNALAEDAIQFFIVNYNGGRAA